MNIILASGSPRRRELLARAQLDFRVLSVDIDESLQDNEAPKDYIERMVATKAAAAIEQLNEALELDEIVASDANESIIILTSDTIGVLPDGKTVLVKPTGGSRCQTMSMKCGLPYKQPNCNYYPNQQSTIHQGLPERFTSSTNSKSLSAQK